jgi:hypothetical protein
MLILHSSVAGGRFFLWGETPAATATRIYWRKSKAKLDQTNPLPFAATAKQLTGVLETVLPSRAKLSTEMATVWLPTAQGRPIASSPLIAAAPDAPNRR